MSTQWEVTFDVYEWMGEEGDSARSTSSDMMNLTTVVQATTSSQAQRMVEAQYGGRVWVKSTYPLD